MTVVIYKICFSHIQMHFITLDTNKIQVHCSLTKVNNNENYATVTF